MQFENKLEECRFLVQQLLREGAPDQWLLYEEMPEVGRHMVFMKSLAIFADEQVAKCIEDSDGESVIEIVFAKGYVPSWMVSWMRDWLTKTTDNTKCRMLALKICNIMKEFR